MPSFRVGSIQVEVILDALQREEPSKFFVDVPRSAWSELVTPDADGLLLMPVQCLLVRVGERLALVDTGLGLDERSPELASASLRRSQLLPELRRLGVTPEQIDLVILSHGHADHLGGNVNPADRRPLFPRARYLIAQADFQHFTSAETQADADGPFYADQLVPLQEHGQLEPTGGELEVLPGVRLLPAPGHTPGHQCIAFTSGQEHALFIGDLIHQTAQVLHPEWYPIFDWMPPMAMESRRRVLEQARREGTLVLTAHLPSPGVGHIGDRWLPIAEASQ